MSKDPHIANIFSAEEEDCLSLEQMTAYQESRLQGQEKHLVERHLLNCELCAMTFESLAENSGESLAEGAEEVTERAWERVAQGAQRKRRGAFLWIATAASIALLVTIGYFSFRGPTDTEMEKAMADAIRKTQPVDFDTSVKSPIAMTDEPKKAPVEETITFESEQMAGPMDAKGGAMVRREQWAAGKGNENSDPKSSAKESATRDLMTTDGDFLGGGEKMQPAKPTPTPGNVNTFGAGSPMQTNGVLSESRAPVLANEPKMVMEKEATTIVASKESAKDSKKEEKKGKNEGYESADFAGMDDAGDIAMEDEEKNIEAAEERPTTVDNIRLADKRDENQSRAKSKSADALGRVEPSPDNGLAKTAPAAPNTNYYSDGIAAYEQGNYREAAANLRKATEATPDNLAAHLYAADAYLRIAQPQAALYHIERILAIPGNTAYEDAEWYKALAYLQLKEAKKAQKQLEQVVTRGGKHRQHAEEALRELK